MRFKGLFRNDLRQLILLLAIFSGVAMLANGFYASYRVQRQLLIDNALAANEAYAQKLAIITEDFLRSTQQQLTYSASSLPPLLEQREALAAETSRLRLQTDSFNSVFIADSFGKVLAISPEHLSLRGTYLTSAGAKQALETQMPLVSPPYLSVAGNLVVALSAPIKRDNGRYLGYVSGTIYLKKENSLNALLARHFHHDGSYVYVVDQSRRLLFHPNDKRIGEVVGKNKAIDAVLSGKTGGMEATDSRGTEVLAGFAPVPRTGWGIVAVRPRTVTLDVLDSLMFGVVRNSVPLALLMLLLTWWLARQISFPLWQLAKRVRGLDEEDAAERLQRVHAWYFEAAELKRALLVGVSLLNKKIGKLSKDVRTDPMTGLLNRRGMRMLFDEWRDEERPFSMVLIDLDHFKQVNDLYGHDAGDSVLIRLSELMRNSAREGDMLCRIGGEEFLMLLPDTPSKQAFLVADRLREYIAQDDMPHVGHITCSMGVAHWPDNATGLDGVLKAADVALYKAKQAGRNKVVIATDPNEASVA